MLQEDQTVSFQPMYDVFIPWYIKLFHLYLILVFLLTILRSTHLAWTLRTLRIAGHFSDAFSARAQDFWEHSYFKARSLKTLSHVTLLISMIALSWSFADILSQVAMQKTAGIGAIAGAFADTLRTFTVGVVISTALLCVSVLFERLIRRRKLDVAREPDK